VKLNKIALLSFILLSSTFSMYGSKFYKPALVGLVIKSFYLHNEINQEKISIENNNILKKNNIPLSNDNKDIIPLAISTEHKEIIKSFMSDVDLEVNAINQEKIRKEEMVKSAISCVEDAITQEKIRKHKEIIKSVMSNVCLKVNEINQEKIRKESLMSNYERCESTSKSREDT
jgi:hypothetical protein